MSWLMSVRGLLNGLKRSKSSSPNEEQLEQLHVKMCESDKLSGLFNIDTVGDFIGNEERRVETYCMDIILRKAKSAPFFSDYVSALLVSWITDLSQQASDKLQVTRNPRLHIENDIHSRGVSPEVVVSFPHKTRSITPFLCVIIRERHRPETVISSAELYSLFAMAAKHHTPLYTSTVNVRLLIVYSVWVQVLTVNATSFHIASILEGRDYIVDKMEIHRTSWFNFLHTSGQLRILLSAFEGIQLQPHSAKKLRLPLKDIEANTKRKRVKLQPNSGNELRNERQKFCRQDANQRISGNHLKD